jgi:hypothetical protein
LPVRIFLKSIVFVRNMIVLDDLMSSAATDPRITDLFSEGTHHRNLSVVVLNLNLYFSKDPTQRRNCCHLLYNHIILSGTGSHKFLTFSNIFLTRYVLPQDDGPLRIAVNGWMDSTTCPKCLVKFSRKYVET